MNFPKLLHLNIWKHSCYKQKKYILGYARTSSLLCQHFDINEPKAKYIELKHPVVKKLNASDIRNLIEVIHELGYGKEVLVEYPQLFGMLPSTLKFRQQVLQECAIQNISPSNLVSFLPLIKQKSIGELKKSGLMPHAVNIENRLASFMTQWPTSLTTLIWGDVNDCTLHALRLKIIQRYLELVLDLTKEEFVRGIETYPTIKHRPLAVINETLTILQSLVMVPPQKIKNNLYLIHADPKNLLQIIYSFHSIGGIDIKEIIRMYPKIATKNYGTLVEIRKVMKEFGISDEAQRRCFQIYTLGPDTIQERLEKAREIPEFNTFLNHPRFLKMILYKNTAMKRLERLYSNNKKCLSLNILSGSSAHYESFEKAPGDRLGKGKDLVFFISKSLNNLYKRNEIHNSIKRHPFWIHIPLVQVQYVHQKLSKHFSAEEIYQNCSLLLYPWSKIQEVLNVLDQKNAKSIHPFSFQQENLNCGKLSKSQKLSLVLYLLEKKHYFTGNGVWTEEKNKSLST